MVGPGDWWLIVYPETDRSPSPPSSTVPLTSRQRHRLVRLSRGPVNVATLTGSPMPPWSMWDI